MFIIAVDGSGRLLVENKPKSKSSNRRSTFCLPAVADSTADNEVLLFFAEIGFRDVKVIRHFELNLSTDKSVSQKYSVYSFTGASPAKSGYEVKFLEELWQFDLDNSIAVALGEILKQVESCSPGSVAKLEERFLRDFDLSKKSSRVFFAKSETVIANESLISFLGAFAVASGEKLARLCMHQNQDQEIQEMMMIHAEPINTGPLRQNRDTSVSYHMLRGALEITLHEGGAVGDKIYQIENDKNQPSVNSSLRVPAKIFRTIRTLTDSAVFVEVQRGPFTDSDTEWQL